MSKPVGIRSLAQTIIAQYGEHGISPAKLQTLTYYVKAWSLVGAYPIITEPFRRQGNRPVNDLLQETYRHFGSDHISVSEGMVCEMSFIQGKIFRFVLDHYTQLSRYTLSELMHGEVPFKMTPSHGIISDPLILSYYSDQPFAQNIEKLVQGQKIEPYYKLKTSGHHAFVMDMSDEDATRALTYPSYDAYRQGQVIARREVAQLWEQ